MTEYCHLKLLEMGPTPPTQTSHWCSSCLMSIPSHQQHSLGGTVFSPVNVHTSPRSESPRKMGLCVCVFAHSVPSLLQVVFVHRTPRGPRILLRPQATSSSTRATIDFDFLPLHQRRCRFGGRMSARGGVKKDSRAGDPPTHPEFQKSVLGHGKATHTHIHGLTSVKGCSGG